MYKHTFGYFSGIQIGTVACKEKELQPTLLYYFPNLKCGAVICLLKKLMSTDGHIQVSLVGKMCFLEDILVTEISLCMWRRLKHPPPPMPEN